MTNIHEKFMQRCLQIAENALGNTSPNPMVGSVIVFNQQIIGEGFHIRAGEPHAEVNAIRSVKNQSNLCQSTLYVNLEPCSHFGKTPPCADLIIEKKIPTVVIGCADPNPLVSGKGIEKLRAAGTEVICGVLEKEAKFLNRRFITYHTKKRPYIILKWAQSADGFIDIKREPGIPPEVHWITDEVCRMMVHKWRAEEDAILTGANTIMTDNPQLNVRYYTGNNPLRIVIDRDNALGRNYHVFTDGNPTVVFCSKPQKDENATQFIAINFDKNVEWQVLDYLYKRQIQSVIIEGGAYTLNRFIEKKLFDEVRFFVGNKLFFDGVKAPALPVLHYTKQQISGNTLFWAYQEF